MTTLLQFLTGLLLASPRDERGLSQSTENVILLVGAVAVAGIVIGVVGTFINGQLVLTMPGMP